MIYKVFAIYDSKVSEFFPPFNMRTKGEAIRAVTQTMSDSKSNFSIHAVDLTLFELAEFDSEKGLYTSLKTPESLGLLVEYKREA